MTVASILELSLAAAVAVYLLINLFFPDRF